MFKGKKAQKYERLGEDGTGEADLEGGEAGDDLEEVEVDSASASAGKQQESTVSETKVDIEEEEEEENDPNSMSLNVKGTDDKTLKVKVAKDASVYDLKSKLASLTEFGVDRQRLIFLGRMLTDNMKLVDYKIKDGNFVHLVPKPAGAGSTTTSSDSRAAQGGPLSEEHISLPNDLSIFRDPGTFPHHHDFTSRNDDYIRRLELGLWRARVRLVCSLCLFYYFLEFMNILAFWLHPDEADQRFEHGHHPSNTYYFFDTIENFYGIMVALKGLKTIAEDSTILSKSFLRDVCKLCVIHFFNLIIWTIEVYQRKIIAIQQHIGKAHKEDTKEQLGMSIGFSILINVMVWFTIISIAAKYHTELRALNGEDEQEQEQEATDSPASSNETSSPIAAPSSSPSAMNQV